MKGSLKMCLFNEGFQRVRLEREQEKQALERNAGHVPHLPGRQLIVAHQLAAWAAWLHLCPAARPRAAQGPCDCSRAGGPRASAVRDGLLRDRLVTRLECSPSRACFQSPSPW